MWADYECPDTRAAWGTVERLLERFGDRLLARLAPLPGPARAPARRGRRRGSRGRRRAAGPSGSCTARLFAHQDEGLEEERLLAHVRAIGLDADQVARELAEHVHAPDVRADKEAGRAIGLRRTPTFVANGEKWDGFYDLETLTELLS